MAGIAALVRRSAIADTATVNRPSDKQRTCPGDLAAPDGRFASVPE